LLDHCGHIFFSLPGGDGVLEHAQRRSAHIQIKGLMVGLTDA
jgi:hypothetical protein